MSNSGDDTRFLSLSQSRISDEELRNAIADLKKQSRVGGMEVEEYFYWMSYVRDHAPQRLLVWGLGYDSVLTDKLNAGGTTAFLEMNATWAATSSNRDLNYRSYDASAFQTSAGAWKAFLKSPHATTLPKQFGVECWDTILVDSPGAYLGHLPGRAVPMYTAREDVLSCLNAGKYQESQAVSVFVHDCKRRSEDGLSTAIFGKPYQEIGPKKLRHFVFKNPSGMSSATAPTIAAIDGSVSLPKPPDTSQLTSRAAPFANAPSVAAVDGSVSLQKSPDTSQFTSRAAPFANAPSVAAIDGSVYLQKSPGTSQLTSLTMASVIVLSASVLFVA
eukprot:TRINITY_DN23542_c0_g1_i1.p1 TRINITY_DN23542_c0_g1~~TRINITY_DN23542_c0_g1_i1.p1  ORF type:complete len:331 (-),score=20.53 TRINITY_DN23542_c0_g1_i1:175-1167(-)